MEMLKIQEEEFGVLFQVKKSIDFSNFIIQEIFLFLYYKYSKNQPS